VAANVLHNNLPVFAPLAALLTVQVTVWESVSRALQRVVGVVVGVLVAYGFARLAGINAWSIALVIFVSLLAGRALRLGQQGSIQVPVSALLVLALGATTKGYAVDRVVDTAIGAGFAIVINLVLVPRAHIDQAQAAVSGVAADLGELLAEIAAQLPATPAPSWAAHLERARLLSDQSATAADVVKRTETATRWSPVGRQDRLAGQRLAEALAGLDIAERAARGIARTLADEPEGWHLPGPIGPQLAALLQAVAGQLGHWAAWARAPGDNGPLGRPGPTDATSGETSVDSLFHAALVATRATEVPPEAAAVASAIALDAHRISQELHVGHELPPPAKFSWQSLFGP
jgi:hypothetical protein